MTGAEKKVMKDTATYVLILGRLTPWFSRDTESPLQGSGLLEAIQSWDYYSDNTPLIPHTFPHLDSFLERMCIYHTLCKTLHRELGHGYYQAKETDTARPRYEWHLTQTARCDGQWNTWESGKWQLQWTTKTGLLDSWGTKRFWLIFTNDRGLQVTIWKFKLYSWLEVSALKTTGVLPCLD